MTTASHADPIQGGTLWTARIVTAVPILFLLFDSVIKLMNIKPVVDAFAQLGWSDSLARGIGALLLVCVVVYAIPRTSVLGAILLTAYLGGAVATQLRIRAPLFSTTLFPVYVGILVWTGLYLREPRLRALVPRRT